MVGDLRSLLQVSKALTEEVRHREGEPLPEVTQLEHTANPSHPSSGVWLQLGILQPLNVLCVDKLLRLPVGLKAPACGRSSPPHTHTAFFQSTGPGSRTSTSSGLRPFFGKLLLLVGLSDLQVGAMLDLPTAQHLQAGAYGFQPPKCGASNHSTQTHISSHFNPRDL